MVYQLPNDVTDADLFNGRLYYISKNTVYTLDLTDSQAAVLQNAPENASALCASDDALYIYQNDTNEIYIYDYTDGGLLEKYSLDQSFSVIDMDYHNGVFVLSDGTDIRVFETKTGKTEDIKLHEHISCLSVSRVLLADENSVIFLALTSITGQYNLFLYHTSDKAFEQLSDRSYSAIDYNQGKLYYSDNMTVTEIDGEKSNPIYRFDTQNDTGVMPEYYLPKKMFVTGTGIVIWDARDHKILTYPIREEKQTLTIVAPDSYTKLIYDADEITTTADITLLTYEDEVYNEKLRVKLLSGDSDYDLYVIPYNYDDVLLLPILKNHLFIDLGQNQELKNNLSQMYSGVSKLMSYNDETFALTTELIYDYINVKDDITQYTDTPPAYGWTCDDLWKLCESLASSGNGKSLFKTGMETYVLNSLVRNLTLAETDLINGVFPEGVKDELRELLTTYDKYQRAGVLFGDDYLIGWGPGGSFPNHNNAAEFICDGYLTVMPKYRSGSGCSMVPNTMIAVNPKSLQISEALEFLAELTDEVNRYRFEIFRSPIYPETEKYADSNGTPIYKDHSDDLLPVINSLDELYQNSIVNLFGNPENITGVTGRYIRGDIKYDEAADEIFQALLYRFME